MMDLRRARRAMAAPFVLLPLLAGSGCESAAPPAGEGVTEDVTEGVTDSPQLETFSDRVTLVQDLEDGGARVAFERSARYYRIDPSRSSGAEELIEFARTALSDGRAVQVTVDVAGTPRRKTRPGPGSEGALPVIVQLTSHTEPEELHDD